jgi:hypothetical protein
MSLGKGTNCGFVTAAPTADPDGVSGAIDTYAHSFKDVAPAGAVRVTEIGWWCDTATEAADYDVAIYTHDAVNNRPDAFVGSALNNAKGLTAGWKVVTGLNIAVTPGTTYWLGVQLDDTSPTTRANFADSVSNKQDWKTAQTSLPDPWGASSTSLARLFAVYAIVELGASDAGFMTLNTGFWGA